MLDSTNKIALVTGANKGIGFEVSRRLGMAGMTVLLGARNHAAQFLMTRFQSFLKIIELLFIHE